MIQKSLNVSIEKGDRDGQWVMAASTKDRVNDTIAPEAFERALKDIGGKLITLWQHDSYQPVGYWHNLTHKAGRLIGDLKLAGTNLGQMIKQLLADEVPLGASIGFRSIGNPEPNKVGGLHFKAIELLETSIVSVPANPAAIQIAKRFHIDLPSIAQADEAVSGPDHDAERVISAAKAAILRANQTLRKR